MEGLDLSALRNARVSFRVRRPHRLLRSEMSRLLPVPVRYPPIALCTDNAAMVAAAGYYRYLTGHCSDLSLDILPNLTLVAEAPRA